LTSPAQPVRDDDEETKRRDHPHISLRIVLAGDAASARFLFSHSLFWPTTPHLVIFLVRGPAAFSARYK
jgi:hypothetical protein